MLPFSKKKKKIFCFDFEKIGKIGEKSGKIGHFREKIGFFLRKNVTFLRKKPPKNGKNRKNSGKNHFFEKKSVKIALFRRKIVILCVQDLKILL